MASRAVPPKHMKAGEDYLSALRSLGLVPRYAGWGWETTSKQWLLVLVTSIVDSGGPLALNRLLFRAYNAHATPREISPFIVRVFSPDIIPDDFWILGNKNLTVSAVSGKSDWKPVNIHNMQKTFLGIEFEMINSYESPPVKRKFGYIDRRQAWETFRKSVERLAA
jgi:hypothetical protein